MQNILKNKTLLALIVVFVIVAFVFYSYFFKGDNVATNNTGLLTAESSTTGVVDRELFNLLAKLKKLNFDEAGAVFGDSRFISLVDFSQPLPIVTVGRQNPFAPIGVGGAVIKPATTQSTSRTASPASVAPVRTTTTATPAVTQTETQTDVEVGDGEVIDGSSLE